MRYLAVICVMLASLSGALAQMTHEETMVRTAYAKFAYAAEQHEMTQIATESLGPVVGLAPDASTLTTEQRLAAAQVNFVLSGFAVGNINDILQRKATDLISQSNQEILVAGQRWYQFAEGGVMLKARSIELSWQPAHSVAPEVQDMKLADLYEAQWHTVRPTAVWQRYASYSVTLRFQNKSYGPYKALFIFGHEGSGNEVIEPEDGVTDASALAYALQDHLFPDALVLTRLRDSPVVANWLNTKQVSNSSCSVGQGNVCCDLVKMQCGPGRDDLAHGLAKAIPNVPAPKATR